MLSRDLILLRDKVLSQNLCRHRKAFVWCISLLILVSLACPHAKHIFFYIRTSVSSHNRSSTSGGMYINHLYTIATISARIVKCKRSNMMRTINVNKCYEYQTYPRPWQTAEINALCYITFWDPNEGQTVYTDLPLSLPSRNTISNRLHYLTLVPKRYNHFAALRKVVYIVIEPVHSPGLLPYISLF